MAHSAIATFGGPCGQSSTEHRAGAQAHRNGSGRELPTAAKAVGGSWARGKPIDAGARKHRSEHLAHLPPSDPGPRAAASATHRAAARAVERRYRTDDNK